MIDILSPSTSSVEMIANAAVDLRKKLPTVRKGGRTKPGSAGKRR
jgi:hypothetical protein